MSMLKKALLYTALATTLAGAATMVTAAPRSVDPYTDGARVTNRDGLVERLGTRDVYTDGARDVRDARNPFVDGAHDVRDPRNPFTDGA
ncbi:MAG: copper resistance protein CopQ [Cupriavidus sp.]|nr:copper resistance protein CopQ [Cupriavidus sp.]MCA3196517.1 copper resistance protein CopQ [Cupriavidus sp.]MCA3205407.1 copper resistance protein CopQ [Cupriavidus sp.]MCA3206221.1 copper resistance protein CopQ [Cupriavidus sp.]QWE97758.1 copper resistance protein CopQ [Cupriavidus sp. EM10]